MKDYIPAILVALFWGVSYGACEQSLKSVDKKIFLQYSSTEMVDSIEQISHKILKEILIYFKISESHHFLNPYLRYCFADPEAVISALISALTAAEQKNRRSGQIPLKSPRPCHHPAMVVTLL